MRTLRNRKLDEKEWIFIKKRLFDEIRGKDSSLYMCGFRMIAGFIRYATTLDVGIIKFDDRRHLILYCSRMGISVTVFNKYLKFLIDKEILFKIGRYEYRLNLSAVQFVNSLPAEPAEKEKEGGPPLQEWDDWIKRRERVEWKRFLLNEIREESLLLLKEEFGHLC